MSYKTAAEAVQRLAIQYQGLIEAAEIFNQLSSFDQAKAENQKAIDALKQELCDTQSELAKAKDAVKKAKDQAADVSSKAETAAAEMLAKAQAEADRIKDAANAASEAVRLAATNDAQKATADAAAKLQSLRNECDLAKAEMAEAEKQRDTALADLNDATKKLDQAKAKVKALME